MERYELAKTEYEALGISTESVMERLQSVPLSIHCWQGDDVGGFEHPNATLDGGGIQVTGNYPGKARNIAELQQDFAQVLTLDGGAHRINLHASYGDFGGKQVERDQIEESHFKCWTDWAKEQKIGIDFNGTFFSHPLANDGFTLASKDEKIRRFWIEHAKRTRKIAAWIGKTMDSPCILDTWIPDGTKNLTVDKMGYRAILKESLDEIFSASYPAEQMRDALETKLFGIGSEAFVVGSHEFYMNYAARNGKMLCIDMGHFNIGEDVSDKLSSILLFDDEILLHVSRPLHWDSDHVVLFNDSLRSMAEEIVRSGKLGSVHIGLDFFDASINRIGAWAVGARAMRKALLFAMLQPHDRLRELEEAGKGFEQMALLERLATLPFGAVWQEYCDRTGTPDDDSMVRQVLSYEERVLSKRG